MKRKIQQELPQAWLSFALTGACLVVFANALTGGFAWDDEVEVLKNSKIRSLDVVGAFGSAFWDFAVVGETRETDKDSKVPVTNYYRPVKTLMYSVAFLISGLSAWAYHGFGVFFHIVAVLALFRILLELSFSSRTAFVATMLFAVHPIHTEAVTWIAGVPDGIAGAFCFLAIWAYLRFVALGRNSFLWVSAVAFLFALFSKEMAITLPLILPFIGSLWTRRSLRPYVHSVTEWIPYAIAISIYGGLRVWALGGVATSRVVEAGWTDWASLGVLVLARYIRYSVVPFPLHVYHLIALRLEDRVIETVLSAGLLALVLFLVWRFRRSLPDLTTSLVIFVLTLSPVFYFKGISGAFFAERYLYIPSFGLALAVASLLERTKQRQRFLLAWGAIIVFAVMTVIRNQDWKDSETLYRSAVSVNEANPHFQSSLGDIALRRGNDSAARERFEAALRYIDEGVYSFEPHEKYRALIGMGALAARSKKYSRARGYLTEALEVNPNGDWAYLYLGGVLLQADRDFSGAMEHFKKAIELGPINEVARDYMGIALLNSGRYREAIPYFQESLEINPNYADARLHLEMAERELRKE